MVATPPLVDPNFDRTVVFVIEHRSDGALGVVLNRPTREHLEPPLDRWAELLGVHDVMFDGGPVEPDGLVALAVASHPADGLTPVAGSIVALDLAGDPVSVAGSVRGLRIFRGYAGWGPGQLERELAAGAWIVLDTDPDDIIGPSPAGLWRSVLRRQSGRLAWLADAPDDLDVN
jgi:putative transcriptional regulator